MFCRLTELGAAQKSKKKFLQTLPTYLYSVVMRHTAEINRVRGTSPMHHAVGPIFREELAFVLRSPNALSRENVQLP